ncbi:MAG: autotransporter-associated beta strand repeat-containing protein [Chthoniobacteraceae bacterium]|nr:autotransporter-associated beta strand repeat-containing protein [Chthoniobacteraceae bacterium]
MKTQKTKSPLSSLSPVTVTKIVAVGLGLSVAGLSPAGLQSAQAITIDTISTSPGDLTDAATYEAGGITPDNTTDILFGASYPTTSGTFQTGALGGVSATNLTAQSLNDLNSNAIVIGNNGSDAATSNATLTLGGAATQANSVSGAAAGDLIYLGGATSNLTIQGANLKRGQSTGTGTLSLNLAQSGNFNVANAGASLTLNAVTSGAVSLTKTGAGTLTLSGANTFGGVGNSFTLSSGTLNINSASALGDANNTFIINGGTLNNTSSAAVTTSNYAQIWNGDFAFTGTKNLNLGTGAVSLGSTPGATRKVTVNGGSLTVGGVISNGTDATTPTVNFVKGGSGSLVLSNANTYTGTTTILGGTVTANKSTSFGTSTTDILVGDTSGSLNAGISMGSGIGLSRNITVQSGNTGTVTLTAYSGVMSGTLTLGSNGAGHSVILTTNGSGNYGGYTGVIQDPSGLAGTAGVVNLVESYNINYFGNANSTYSGGTVISMSDPSNTNTFMSFNSGHIFGTGTVTINSLVARQYNNASAVISGTNNQIWNGDWTVNGGSGNILNWGLTGTIDLGATGTSTTRMLTTSGTAIIAGSMQNGSNGFTNSFTKAGVALLTLTGSSGYTGGTWITSGTLRTGNAAALGTGQVKLTSINTTGLDLNGSALSIDSLTSGIGSATITGSGSGYAQATTTVTVSGGGGTGATATATVTSGKISGITITNYGSNYTSTPTFTINGVGTGATVTGNFGPSNVTLGSGTLTLNGTNTSRAVYSGIVSGVGGSIVKNGSGVQEFSATNTYTGATHVNAGTLVVSGSIAGSSTIVGDLSQPSAAAILMGGNGTASASATVKDISAVSSGAIIDPGVEGNTAGILNTNSLSLSGGAHLAMQIGGITAGGNSAAGYDRLNVLGADSASISGGVLDLTTLAGTVFTGGDELLFLLVNNGIGTASDPFSAVTLNGQTLTDLSNITIGGEHFALTYTADYNNTGLYGGESSGGNDVALMAVVPEPQTWAMLVGGVGMLMGFQRLRKRQVGA